LNVFSKSAGLAFTIASLKPKVSSVLPFTDGFELLAEVFELVVVVSEFASDSFEIALPKVERLAH
jgi:hypothetical protein